MRGPRAKTAARSGHAASGQVWSEWLFMERRSPRAQRLQIQRHRKKSGCRYGMPVASLRR